VGVFGPDSIAELLAEEVLEVVDEECEDDEGDVEEGIGPAYLVVLLV